jgi:hypothetical protein
MSAAELPLVISWFPTAMPTGPAYGEPEHTTWANFASVISHSRREGDKDGPNFVAARFTLEPDSRRVRRLKANLLARTAVALDCETNKETGELPPSFAEAVGRIHAIRRAAVVYTSHNHQPVAPRYRIVLPLSEEIDPELPDVEVVADRLVLAGVLDRGKLGAASLCYLPSCEYGCVDDHQVEVIEGEPIDAMRMRQTAGAIVAKRQAEQDRLAEEAHKEAAARREAKIAAGFDPDDSLIEKLRVHFDLAGVLQAHGYDRSGTKFRHPNSSSGSFGADIRAFAAVERVFSHNATDPLHARNLPDWCGGVTALDVIDVVTILDYGGNRTRALAELAQRFGMTKAAEQGKLAALLFRLIRQQVTQDEFNARAYAEGERLGMTRVEVERTVVWVVSQMTTPGAA